MVANYQRTKAIGNFGEQITAKLLQSAGFTNIRDLNALEHNHPFADYYAERNGHRYVISVRARNMWQANGKLNPGYNVCKKGANIQKVADKYGAELAWITIQVDVKSQRYSAYFGTLAELNVNRVLYSVPMKARDTARYECIALGLSDPQIRPEWTNRPLA